MLDTPRESSFDELADLAAKLCDTPIAVVNLVGADRQFFKAEVGLGVRETPFDSSFCAKAILEDEFLLVPDTTQDARFDCNPLVLGEPHIRFYAGALLKTADGVTIGTLCVLDYRPRDLTELQQHTLRILARQVMAQLDLGKAVREKERQFAAAQESETRYRTLFESIESGFCLADVVQANADGLIDYRITDANPAFYRQTGFSEAIRGSWLRNAVPNLEEHWFETYGQVARTGEATRFEQGSDALGRWFDVFAFRVGEPGEGRIAILFNDISARRRVEQELQHLNTTLEQEVANRTAQLQLSRDIIEASVDPICAFDTDYRLIAFNQAHSDDFFRIFGHRVQLGEVFPDLFLAEQAPIMRGFMTRALTGESFTVSEEFGDPALVKPYWEVSYSPLRDADGRVIGAFHYARDISARLRGEAELAATQEALRQSQKMEAVGQLTGGLAHDFNNLLTGMMGNLELLQLRVARGRHDDLDRFVNAAQGAGRRAASLTQRLLAFSRRQTLDPKPTDVNKLLFGLEEMLLRTVGATTDIEIVGAAGLWIAEIDAGQLENAVLNLCINGRDAMPGGGKLTIETANKWLDDRTSRERDLPPGQYISLCVTDAGTGMSAETIERAFEPFFTTKPIGQGTGLGLSMIYGFARQSGGQARIYSELGHGTTVCIYLPRHHGEVLPEVPDQSGAPVDGGSGQTVLVIDDEPTIRHLIDEVLDDLGYTVIGAGDGAAGIKVLQSGARIDLLITDVGLPNGMNGRQVADEARRLRPGLHVLFITGFAENAAVGNGHLEPGMELLTKPFTLDALSSKVASILDRQGR
ncbi:MAG: PAS domain-containing protein [Pseudomonadota bacterium]